MQQQPDSGEPVRIDAAPSNRLGTTGFITSLVGFLTCGLLSPIALLMSIPALFKAPRGLAIAGTVLGLLGSAWLVVAGFAMVAGLAKFRQEAEKGVFDVQKGPSPPVGIPPSLPDEIPPTEYEPATRVELPTEESAPPFEVDAPAEEPEIMPAEDAVEVKGADPYRTWTSDTGSRMEAQFVSVVAGIVTLRKRGGKVIELPIEKLSSEDQVFVFIRNTSP